MTGEIAADEIDHLLQTIERVRVTLRVAIPAATTRLPELARGEKFLHVGRLRDVTAISAPLDRVKGRIVFLEREQLPKAGVRLAFDLVRDPMDRGKLGDKLRTNRERRRVLQISR